MILTTKKTEERDDAIQCQYREDEERRRVEDSRQSDVADERGIWSNTFQTRLEQEFKLVDAIRDADAALDAYRVRFQ